MKIYSVSYANSPSSVDITVIACCVFTEWFKIDGMWSSKGDVAPRMLLGEYKLILTHEELVLMPIDSGENIRMQVSCPRDLRAALSVGRPSFNPHPVMLKWWNTQITISENAISLVFPKDFRADSTNVYLHLFNTIPNSVANSGVFRNIIPKSVALASIGGDRLEYMHYKSVDFVDLPQHVDIKPAPGMKSLPDKIVVSIEQEVIRVWFHDEHRWAFVCSTPEAFIRKFQDAPPTHRYDYVEAGLSGLHLVSALDSHTVPWSKFSWIDVIGKMVGDYYNDFVFKGNKPYHMTIQAKQTKQPTTTESKDMTPKIKPHTVCSGGMTLVRRDDTEEPIASARVPLSKGFALDIIKSQKTEAHYADVEVDMQYITVKLGAPHTPDAIRFNTPDALKAPLAAAQKVSADFQQAFSHDPLPSLSDKIWPYDVVSLSFSSVWFEATSMPDLILSIPFSEGTPLKDSVPIPQVKTLPPPAQDPRSAPLYQTSRLKVSLDIPFGLEAKLLLNPQFSLYPFGMTNRVEPTAVKVMLTPERVYLCIDEPDALSTIHTRTFSDMEKTLNVFFKGRNKALALALRQGHESDRQPDQFPGCVDTVTINEEGVHFFERASSGDPITYPFSMFGIPDYRKFGQCQPQSVPLSCPDDTSHQVLVSGGKKTSDVDTYVFPLRTPFEGSMIFTEVNAVLTEVDKLGERGHIRLLLTVNMDGAKKFPPIQVIDRKIGARLSEIALLTVHVSNRRIMIRAAFYSRDKDWLEESHEISALPAWLQSKSQSDLTDFILKGVSTKMS